MEVPLLKPRRTIEGCSAVLLPFKAPGQPDVEAWAGLLERTWAGGLTPAVNMDTGYVNLLSRAERSDLLVRAGQLARRRRFIAGAFIEGQTGDPGGLYSTEAVAIQEAGGVPILFPCSAVKQLSELALVEVFRSVAKECPEFLGFELGEMFVPFGRIWSLATFEALLDIPQLKGAKHSSLSRELEWQRLAVRDRRRPDFKLYTGNDLAIDLVRWGSDYLLGLSAFHVEAFAARDRLWAKGDAGFHELNDWLQYLGMLAFRAPVPAYKHSCAQFLFHRGLIATPEPHPQNPRRPASDLALLEPIAQKLDALVAAAQP
ncbi:MAG TPA: dihydrodipicolinate synthase family protein [Verrucomicrobiota bacterium]|nr:dihydrodipicolinate synthase family protein [Verrucomicrobiales bacterium]HRI15757.1 dihydrodipicolinate synthase family protein [Verrucomicrobiota bacterium]